MVDPPLHLFDNGPGGTVLDKAELRTKLRTVRREYVTALPDSVRALVFNRPPTAVQEILSGNEVIGLYNANKAEAPALAYAKWFHERGHVLALPSFADRNSPMSFRQWEDPYADNTLEPGPFGLGQPVESQPEATPDIVFVPLLGFTASGDRLGQGAGHYDRWLEAHPDAVAIGLAWDCQLLETLPVEPHDRPLAMVVTPTRVFEVNA